jgi:excisionase family DNA binding protein
MLTVDEAAALKQVHPETIRRALRRGEFRRARAVGGSGKRKVWILDRQEVEEWQPRPVGWPRKE